MKTRDELAEYVCQKVHACGLKDLDMVQGGDAQDFYDVVDYVSCAAREAVERSPLRWLNERVKQAIYMSDVRERLQAAFRFGAANVSRDLRLRPFQTEACRDAITGAILHCQEYVSGDHVAKVFYGFGVTIAGSEAEQADAMVDLAIEKVMRGIDRLIESVASGSAEFQYSGADLLSCINDSEDIRLPARS